MRVFHYLLGFVALCGFFAPSPVAAESIFAKGGIVIPSVEFADTPLGDAVAFLVERSVELDREEPDPNRKGVNVVLVGKGLHEARVTVSLRNVPVGEIFGVVAELAGAKVSAGADVVVISKTDLPSVVRRSDGSESLEEKMKNLVVPTVEFADTPLGDALAFLGERSEELGGGPGVNVVLKGDRELPVTFRVRNVSLFRTLELVALVAGYEMEIREHLVFFRERPKNL